MRLPLSLSFGAALFGASLLVGPASAASVAGAVSKDFLGQSSANPAPSYVQLAQAGPRIGPQRAGGGRRGGGHRGVYRGGGYRGGGYYRGRNDGDWVGGAAAGAALGLFLGAAIANQAQSQDAIGYCMRRYRSYDPQSMTYLGYDGLRHPCP